MSYAQPNHHRLKTDLRWISENPDLLTWSVGPDHVTLLRCCARPSLHLHWPDPLQIGIQPEEGSSRRVYGKPNVHMSCQSYHIGHNVLSINHLLHGKYCRSCR